MWFATTAVKDFMQLDRKFTFFELLGVVLYQWFSKINFFRRHN